MFGSVIPLLKLDSLQSRRLMKVYDTALYICYNRRMAFCFYYNMKPNLLISNIQYPRQHTTPNVLW